MQGVQLLGHTADDLAALRNNDEAAFGRVIKAAKWSEWSMTLAARSREYNGERRMRYTVARVSHHDSWHASLCCLQVHDKQANVLTAILMTAAADETPALRSATCKTADH